jgi:hypothetical protein
MFEWEQRSLDQENKDKFEARNPKYETISNNQSTKFETIKLKKF